MLKNIVDYFKEVFGVKRTVYNDPERFSNVFYRLSNSSLDKLPKFLNIEKSNNININILCTSIYIFMASPKVDYSHIAITHPKHKLVTFYGAVQTAKKSIICYFNSKKYLKHEFIESLNAFNKNILDKNEGLIEIDAVLFYDNDIDLGDLSDIRGDISINKSAKSSEYFDYLLIIDEYLWLVQFKDERIAYLINTDKCEEHDKQNEIYERLLLAK